MCPEKPSSSERAAVGPDLTGVVADAEAAGLPYVVIGGFAVIFHGHVRATRDCDLLVPDGAEANCAIMRFLAINEALRLRDEHELSEAEVGQAEQLRVLGRYGIVDLLRGGVPPLDFESVRRGAESVRLHGQPVVVASLASIVAFKRLAARPDPDQSDLRHLEAINGKLPIEPLPGLDSD